MKSLKRDIVLRMLLGSLVLLAIWLALTLTREIRQSDQDMRRFADSSARELAGILAEPLWSYDFALTGTILRAKLAHPAVRALLLRTEDNEVMGYAEKPGMERPILLREEPEWDRNSATISITYRDSELERTIGSVTVYPSREHFRSRIGGTVLQDAAALSLALLILLMLLYEPLRNLFRRIHDLASTADAIARGEHGRRTKMSDEGDELSKVADAVNRMAGNLTHAAALLQQEQDGKKRAEEALDRERNAAEEAERETGRLLAALRRALQVSSDTLRSHIDASVPETAASHPLRRSDAAGEAVGYLLRLVRGIDRYIGKNAAEDEADDDPVQSLEVRRFFRRTAARIRRRVERRGGSLYHTIERAIPADLPLDDQDIGFVLEALAELLITESDEPAPHLKLHVGVDRLLPSGQSIDLAISFLSVSGGSEAGGIRKPASDGPLRTDPSLRELTLILCGKILRDGGGTFLVSDDESGSPEYSIVIRGLIIPPPRGNPAERNQASHDK